MGHAVVLGVEPFLFGLFQDLNQCPDLAGDDPFPYPGGIMIALMIEFLPRRGSWFAVSVPAFDQAIHDGLLYLRIIRSVFRGGDIDGSLRWGGIYLCPAGGGFLVVLVGGRRDGVRGIAATVPDGGIRCPSRGRAEGGDQEGGKKEVDDRTPRMPPKSLYGVVM